MKRTIILTLSMLTVAAFIFTGCGKYEEGPAISLRSKKGRLAGDWKVEKATQTTSGITIDVTSALANQFYGYDKEGGCTFTMGSVMVAGTWKFSDDKLMVIRTWPLSVDTMHLTRLTNKEMWEKSTSGNVTEEIHWVAK